MPARVKIDPIDRDLTLFVDGRLSPAAQAKARGDYARGVIADAQRRNSAAGGGSPAHRTFVDGRAEAPLESVSPNGNITAVFDLVAPMLVWIHQRLRANSPVKTGRYRDSHVLFADGVEIDPAAAPPEAEQFIFTNVQPYARRIEVGGTKITMGDSSGVYEGVALLAARRFGNVAKIAFSYRSPLMGYVAMGGRRAGRTAGPAKRSAANMERTSRQPAIIITMRG